MGRIIRNKNQRVAVLVDVQNLYYSAKSHFSSRINFANLLKIAVADRILVRSIAYVIKSDERETEFFDAVYNAGFEIKEKDIQIFPDGSKKGDWDVGIVMDAIRLGEKVDSIVLVSGDGDYRPLVAYLQQRFGCLVEVIAFEITCSNRLQEEADDFLSIEEVKKDLLFKTRNSIGTGRAYRKNKSNKGNSSRKESNNSNQDKNSNSKKQNSSSRRNNDSKSGNTNNSSKQSASRNSNRRRRSSNSGRSDNSNRSGSGQNNRNTQPRENNNTEKKSGLRKLFSKK